MPAATVASYNDAIAHVAGAEDAELVDLHALGVEAEPDTASQAQVAEAFAAAL